jgi:hypothetical protein
VSLNKPQPLSRYPSYCPLRARTAHRGGNNFQRSWARQRTIFALRHQFSDINFLNFVTKQRADAKLIKFLGLEGGKIMEWRPVEQKDKVEFRGTDIDSDYDLFRKPTVRIRRAWAS